MPEQNTFKQDWKSFLKNHHLLGMAAFFIAFFVFFKNAWVAEDSFILFRSLEQLAIGNGPIWNPHERVQVFTSPLWFWLQAIVRILSSHVYFNVIAISFLLWGGTLFVLKKYFKNNLIFLLSVLLFVASTAFFDYTSSGLENVLAYFLIAVSLDRYSSLFLYNKQRESREIAAERRDLKVLSVSLGLLICTRHDLVLLFFPAIVYTFWQKYKCFSLKEWVSLSLLALSPFIAWTIFSVLYYGFPFPNTAYAKLNTGIEKQALIANGINYFKASLKLDTITLPLIASFLIASFSNLLGKHVKPLAYGVILNLMYVAYVGGDFMQGRFFSYAYMVAVVIFLNQMKNQMTMAKLDFKKILVGLLAIYFVVYPHTPLTSPISYSNPNFGSAVYLGVADERGFYSGDLSMFNYSRFASQDIQANSSSFAQIARKEGLKLKNSQDTISYIGNIGVYGYWAGTEKIIVDLSALSDPLLARQPTIERKRFRAGHYQRALPNGYVDSIRLNQELIEDPQINQLYKQLKLVTQSKDLFAWERIKAIIALNTH